MYRRLCRRHWIKPTNAGDFGRQAAFDHLEAELEESSLVSTLSVFVIAAVALMLAVLPAAIALQLLTPSAGWVGVALGCLGAAAGGVKLIAVAWAMGTRLAGAHPDGGAIAAVE